MQSRNLSHSVIAGLAMTALAALSPVLQGQEPIGLQQALRLTLENSEEMRIERETLFQREQEVRDAYSNAMPKVSAYANAGRGQMPQDASAFGDLFGSGGGGPGGGGGTTLPDVLTTDPTNRYAYGLELQQPIYTFGKVGTAVKGAKKYLRAAGANLERAAESLQLQVVEAWNAVALSRARLGVLDESRARQEELVTFLERNFRLGAGAKAHLLMAKAQLASLEPEEIRGELDTIRAAMNLNRLMGRSPDAPLILDTAASIKALDPGPLPDFEPALVTALKHRSDLEALELTAEGFMDAKKLFRANYLPSIGATGKFGILAFDPDQLGDWENRDWQIGVGLQWNLFDGYSSAAQAAGFASQARSMRARQSQLRDFVEIELKGSLAEAKAADAALDAARQLTDAAGESLEQQNRDFKSGHGSLTDLLSAEETLRQAQLGLLAAQYAQLRSRAALRVAMGLDILNTEEK